MFDLFVTCSDGFGPEGLWMRSLRRRRDEMCLEIARPVRREPARTTVSAQLQRAFQMPQFDPKPREGCERVDDQSTAVTGDVIALVGIRLRLNRAVWTDRMRYALVCPPRVRCPKHRSRHRLTKRTAADRLLRVHTDDSIPRVVESNLSQRPVGWPPPMLGLRPGTSAPVAANEGLCRHPHRILVDFSAVR